MRLLLLPVLLLLAVPAFGAVGTQPPGGTNSAGGGVASLIGVTNITFLPSPTFLRGTNHWFDGGISGLYTNTLVANSGGVSNLLATNILEGQTVRLEIFPETGVTAGFPQFTAAQWGGAIPKIETNLWNVIEVTRHGSVTNARHSIVGYELAASSNITFSTNHVTRVISVASASANYKAFAVIDGTRYEDDGTWYHLVDEEFNGNFGSTTSGANGREGWVHIAQGTIAPSPQPLAESGAFGYISLVTSNTTTGALRSIIDSSSTAAGSLLATNCQFVWLCRMRIGNTNVTGEVYASRFGLANASAPHTEPTAGCWITSNTNINTNTFVAVTSRSSTRTFNYSVTASGTWTNMVWYWIGQRLDSTGTNIISFVGPTPATLTPFATNSANIPENTMIGPFFANHRILLTTPPLHTTNFWDSFHLWAKPN